MMKQAFTATNKSVTIAASLCIHEDVYKRQGYNSNRPDLKIPELLKTYLNSNRISSHAIATVIGDDNNIMEAEIVQTLCNEGIIEYDDLENISGIDSAFVDKLIDFKSVSYTHLI